MVKSFRVQILIYVLIEYRIEVLFRQKYRSILFEFDEFKEIKSLNEDSGSENNLKA